MHNTHLIGHTLIVLRSDSLTWSAAHACISCMVASTRFVADCKFEACTRLLAACMLQIDINHWIELNWMNVRVHFFQHNKHHHLRLMANGGWCCVCYINITMQSLNCRPMNCHHNCLRISLTQPDPLLPAFFYYSIEGRRGSGYITLPENMLQITQLNLWLKLQWYFSVLCTLFILTCSQAIPCRYN